MCSSLVVFYLFIYFIAVFIEIKNVFWCQSFHFIYCPICLYHTKLLSTRQDQVLTYKGRQSQAKRKFRLDYEKLPMKIKFIKIIFSGPFIFSFFSFYLFWSRVKIEMLDTVITQFNFLFLFFFFFSFFLFVNRSNSGTRTSFRALTDGWWS